LHDGFPTQKKNTFYQLINIFINLLFFQIKNNCKKDEATIPKMISLSERIVAIATGQ
jgi:hypothetical protein